MNQKIKHILRIQGPIKNEEWGKNHKLEGSNAKVDETAESEGRKRTSAKPSFVAKIFSPVIDYDAYYELQHFVYDL